MKVHMVTHWVGKIKLAKPWPRYAHYLQSLGWTASHKLDPNADVNYILTFSVGWRRYKNPWDVWKRWGGPLVCTFNLRPLPGPKQWLWDKGVRAVDLRLVPSQSRLEKLAKYGPTEVMPAYAMERDLFVIAGRRNHEKPVIGVAGYSVKAGRRGSHLVKQLAAHSEWRVKGAGKGWPVKTRRYKYRKLPRFYQSLDIYLNTATRRDTSTGIFQAAACGIPVVIPHDLPVIEDWDMHGVYHYERGNFDSMLDAIRKCAAELGTHDRKGIRALTKEVTIKNFCAGHKRIFDKHFGGTNVL